MASNRSKAKSDLIKESGEVVEPAALTEIFARSELERKEDNRSKEEMRRLDIQASKVDRGAVGWLIGGRDNAATATAFIAMAAGMLGTFGCFLGAYFSSSSSTWINAGELFLAFAGSALGYIFGRGTRR